MVVILPISLYIRYSKKNVRFRFPVSDTSALTQLQFHRAAGCHYLRFTYFRDGVNHGFQTEKKTVARHLARVIIFWRNIYKQREFI